MSTATTKAREHQDHWKEIVRDPVLRDLPYKVETNARGQLILSPHKAYHSRQQKAVLRILDRLLPGGAAFPEYPIATSEGVKQADVIWASQDRLRDMEETGDPPTLAPEICVEILSDTNTEREMTEKRALYREGGTREVWMVEQNGRVRFFAGEEIDESALAPDFPDHL